jgi:hypothetical protein
MRSGQVMRRRSESVCCGDDEVDILFFPFFLGQSLLAEGWGSRTREGKNKLRPNPGLASYSKTIKIPAGEKKNTCITHLFYSLPLRLDQGKKDDDLGETREKKISHTFVADKIRTCAAEAIRWPKFYEFESYPLTTLAPRRMVFSKPLI